MPTWDEQSAGSEEETLSALDAAAKRLHILYVDELRRSLRPPVHPMVNGTQTQSMVRRACDVTLGLCEERDATTWIWSDLHLGHKPSITTFDRPFRTPREMDQAMIAGDAAGVR